MSQTRHPHPTQTAAEILKREQRNALIIELKRSGKSHKDIAAEVGCDANTVTKVHREWIAEVHAQGFTDAALYVAEALDRYGALLAAQWAAAMQGNDKAAAECRRLITAMTDLTVPKVQPGGDLPGDTDVDRWLRGLDAEITRRAIAAERETAAGQGEAGRG